MNELLTHYNNLIVILQKMNDSQMQDLGIANEQVGLAQQETQLLKTQLDICKNIAEDQAEKIVLLNRIRTRARVVSYVEFGIGVPCLILGCLPIWTNEQQNIKNLFLGIGATSTAAGIGTLTISFYF